MNKRLTFSPVLLELIVVILFFALSMSVVIRLVAAADETSRLSELTGSALIAMENAAEEIKADPASGPFDANGAYSLTRETEDGILLSISVWKTAGAGGTLYSIELSATAAGRALGRLSAARYVSGEVEA